MHRFMLNILAAALICGTFEPNFAHAQNAFTYQGRLRVAGTAYTGSADVRFTLFDADAGGNSLGVQEVLGAAISEGLLQTSLDFGAAAFDGSPRWLEIAIATPAAGGGGSYTTLAPRQLVSPVPYALHALNAPFVSSGTSTVFSEGGNVIVETAADSTGFVHSDGVTSIGTYVGGGAGWLGTTTNSDLYFFTGAPTLTSLVNAPGMVLNTNGRVGIGTSTPLAQLDIAASGTGAEILRFSTERPWVFRQIYSGPSAGLQLLSTVGAKQFEITCPTGPNVATFLAEDANPRVGIGTTAPVPYARLHVKTPSFGYGIYAESGEDAGVVGESKGVNEVGILGVNHSLNGLGVLGQGDKIGVQGSADGDLTTGFTCGVFGTVVDTSSSWAMYAAGAFAATGTKSFQIDHPLDPTNKYLNHYCAEGPEPLNVYRGNVTLDDLGQARITMPEYFAFINRDPSYQLTAIGGAAPNLHVAQEIATNGRDFVIAGGRPGMKVSWRVEAVRNDRFVQRHGAPVEQDKPNGARGTYLQPELYDQPEELGQFHRAQVGHDHP